MVIILVFLALAALFILISLGVYILAFRSPNRTQNDDFHTSLGPEMAPLQEKVNQMISSVLAIPYQKVSLTSRDGLKLNARYYPAGKESAWRENGLAAPFDEATAPLVILCHGWRGTPARDFSGGAKMMIDAGFHVLAIEQRAHVSSEGHTITFGVKERLDVLDWIRFGKEELHADRIFLVGISMGAATVLMDAADVPEEVIAILADCPYTTPLAIIQKVGRSLHCPGWLTRLLACFGARVFGGFDLTDPDADALRAVRDAKVPILIIHGEADDFVPCEMSRELMKANPEKVHLETFPGAGHGLSFLVDPKRYKKVTLSFIADKLQ